ncbi:MAG TPA: diguanylate cyclase [Roseiflexaceae bacterium]|nr:diguanylate cyclase [Roseiflexaceae bacterium]
MRNDNALRDVLTGAFSRAALQARLQQEVDEFSRYAKAFSLIVIDIDHFKSVNDVFGHTRGDITLLEFATRLRMHTRMADQVFRYGGDEFVLLLPHTDKPKALIFARRLLEGISLQPFDGDPPLSLSASLGIATCPEDGRDPQQLFEVADRRHLVAKRAGRNRAVADDRPDSRQQSLEQPSRLLERDRELGHVQQFLAALPEHRRGMIVVSGVAGAGRTRFLEEVRRIAGMQGYLAISLQGGPGLRYRVYGAISDAISDEMPSPALGADAFAAAMIRAIERERAAGVLITLDQAHQIDRATQQFLQRLYLNVALPQFAVVAAVEPSDPPLDLLREATYQLALALTPLTQASVQIWLRHSLQWDAPESFVRWFHQQTSGLPQRIQAALPLIIDAQLVHADDEGWSVEPSYTDYRLAELLDQKLALPPHNLAQSMPDLIGREHELRRLRLLLQHARLVTIVGPGGMGKTRLALQAAAENMQQFADGVFFISLSAVNTADDIIPAIVSVVPFTMRPDGLAQCAEMLRGREILLVLDNFEHLMAGVHLLEALVAQAGSIRILLTAHTQMNATDEEIVELSGLPYPSHIDDPHVEQYDAVQLFLHSARQMHAAIVPGSRDMIYVAQICRLVEGMPLGIELATAWIPSAGLDEIAADIERSVTSLNSERSDVPARHRSLRAVVESFWHQLSPDEQVIIQRLSIFHGGFDRYAAQIIAGASLFFLNALANQRYLVRTTQGRYEFHQLLRQYAIEVLQAQPEERSRLHDAHCEYYMRLLESHADALARAMPAAVRAVSAEHENLRAAWRWAVAQVRIHAIVRGAPGLTSYLAALGAVVEAEASLRLAIDYLRILIDEDDDKPDDRDMTRYTLAILYTEHARTLIDLGSFDQALVKAQQALQLANAIAQPAIMAQAHLWLGRVYRFHGALDEAHTNLQQAYELAEAEGMPATAAQALYYQGYAAYYSGTYDEALAHYEASLARQRLVQNTPGESNVVSNISLVWMQCGYQAEALRFANQAVMLAHASGHPMSRCWSLICRALVQHDRGAYATACNDAQEAVRTAHEAQSSGISLTAHLVLGYAQLGDGRFDAAEATLLRTLDMAQAHAMPVVQADAMVALADIALARGALDVARSWIDRVGEPDAAAYANRSHMPLRYLLTSWRVLMSCGDPRSASLLAAVEQHLVSRAQRIGAEQLREHFLSRSPIARALIQVHSRV